MPNRLYSDLLDGTGRRYYFGLNSATGGITNSAPALITIGGLMPAFQELTIVFRTPATALLTLNGLASGAGLVLQPILGAVSMIGLVPTLLKQQVITNALPLDYTTPVELLPTIIYIATVTPDPATLTVGYPQPNVTQGGNILMISAGLASLTINGQIANLPFVADLGGITIAGLVPTLLTETTITPDQATVTINGGEVTISAPFMWVDETSPATTTWIDE